MFTPIKNLQKMKLPALLVRSFALLATGLLLINLQSCEEGGNNNPQSSSEKALNADDQAERYDTFPEKPIDTFPNIRDCFCGIDSLDHTVINTVNEFRQIRDSVLASGQPCDSADLARAFDFERHTYLFSVQMHTGCLKSFKTHVVEHPKSDTITMYIKLNKREPRGNLDCDVIRPALKIAEVSKISPGNPIQFADDYDPNWCWEK